MEMAFFRIARFGLALFLLVVLADPVLRAQASMESSSRSPEAAFPDSPEPSGWLASPAIDEHPEVPWAAKAHQQPFSRVGIGADVSPLGIGIKSAVVLSQYFDARALISFFNFDSGSFELEGFRVDAKLHLTSLGATVDYYPFNSVWRLSGGLMLLNHNQLSVASRIVPGTSFSLNGQNVYSDNLDPLNGTGVLGMHRHSPAFLVSGGFGKFIPRSHRHWSFPSEFGVVFTGAPTIDVNVAGSVCLDAAQTECSSISSASPVATEFNSNLQAQLQKWRTSVSAVTVYPIFSYSVVYSFDIR